jgi:osmotically-inducible protein OsmY
MIAFISDGKFLESRPSTKRGSRTMAKATWTMITAAVLALSGSASLGCASTKTHESAGEYIDDSVITTKVKAEILNDPSLKYFQISVKTFKGIVQLSGFVDSEQAVRRAGEVASGVRGVSSVRNDLIVK